MSNHTPQLALFIAFVAGCSYDEGIEIRDLQVSVVVPEAAATRTFLKEDGSSETVTDPRLIGPVYLGFYPSVKEGLYPYTHPEMGPVFQDGVAGDAYPYGGATIGDIRFPCVEFLRCKVVSGRYVDFDQMVTWFNDTLQMPITDGNHQVVESGEYIAQTCFEQLNYVADEEIRLTATEDRNEDGVLDGLDLDFVRQADGSFQADITILQQEYFQNPEGDKGFTLWGWMDAPSPTSNQFSTCDPTQGFQLTEYNNDFYAGRPYRDLLNFPGNYIGGGDWVSKDGFQYSSPDDVAVITLDQPVE